MSAPGRVLQKLQQQFHGVCQLRKVCFDVAGARWRRRAWTQKTEKGRACDCLGKTRRSPSHSGMSLSLPKTTTKTAMFCIFSGRRVPVQQTRKTFVLWRTLSSIHHDSLLALASIRAPSLAATFLLLYSTRGLPISQKKQSSVTWLSSVSALYPPKIRRDRPMICVNPDPFVPRIEGTPRCRYAMRKCRHHHDMAGVQKSSSIFLMFLLFPRAALHYKYSRRRITSCQPCQHLTIPPE